MNHSSSSESTFCSFQLLGFLLLVFSTVSAQQSKEITLNDIFKTRTFAAARMQSLPSMKDGKSYVSVKVDKDKNRYVAKNSYSDGREIAVLFKESDLVYSGDTLDISTDFSNDENKVLLSTDEESIYRHSVRANYYVYDLQSKKITPVSAKGKQQLATFSPDASKIAFVRNNNIFIKDLLSGAEKQITTDGKENHIINGHPDWVYEEEFSFTQGFFWSPDGSKIAYYKFDESEVPEYSMTIYEKLYPTEYKYKYPKAGERNSRVSIHVFNLSDGATKRIDVGSNEDQYIPRVKWTNSSDVLCILRLNRHQNKLEYLLGNAKTGSSKVILTEEDKYYIDIEKQRLSFLKNGKYFINTSERDGYNHLYLYDLNGRIVRQLTKGDWEVTEVYGIDEKNNVIYYQSTESSPLQRDIYSITTNGTRKTRLSSSAGTNDASFSSDFSYFILSNSTINQPPLISLNAKGGKIVRMLENNSRIKRVIEDYKIAPTEFFTFKTSEGVDLHGSIIKPANFNPQQKHPVLMFVYGGPGSQQVANGWAGTRQMWYHMLAQKGYLVVSVDNRGTGFRGAEFKKMTYKELGKYETIDQIEAAKWLAKQSYVDPSRIGIWGWSYGGYMSALCITKGADVFKMAMAVAPVTTWRFYDTIYTERYLRTPQENPDGYDKNSPINFVNLLKGKFLLVHGTGDDNVHFQNSVMLSEALIQANKQFEQAYYPNKNHGIGGGNTTFHLYTKLTDFVLKNL